MKFRTRFILISLAVGALIAYRGEKLVAADKSAKLPPVRIGYVSRSILDMPYLIAGFCSNTPLHHSSTPTVLVD
jgi:hypothetical protein